jgi:hypothetical protein
MIKQIATSISRRPQDKYYLLASKKLVPIELHGQGMDYFENFLVKMGKDLLSVKILLLRYGESKHKRKSKQKKMPLYSPLSSIRQILTMNSYMNLQKDEYHQLLL